MSEKFIKSDEEWRAILSPEQFRVMRNHGTEKPYSCEFIENHSDGTYHCSACDLPLFKSLNKFDSKSGWPSFGEPHSDENLEYIIDNSYGMQRTEVRCARCDSHLGHVFDDGPRPTGKRYCMNGVALRFKPNE